MKELLKIIKENFVAWFWILLLFATAIFARENTSRMVYDIRIGREFLAQLLLSGFFIVIISGLIPQIREYKNKLIALLLGWILYTNARLFTEFSRHALINISLYSFLLFATIRCLPSNDIEKVLKALCWLVVLQCFWCTIQLLQYDGIFYDALEKGTMRNRPVGTMDNESLFGAYLSFLIPLCFIWHKWQWNLIGIIAIGFLFISKSVIALVSGFAGVMTLIFLRSYVKQFRFKIWKWWVKLYFIRGFTIVVILLLISAIGIYKAGIIKYKDKELKIFLKDKQLYCFDLHNSGRFQHWKESLELSRKVSWFGLGIGNYRPFMIDKMKGQTARTYAQAHNDFLQMLNETGIIGIMLYLTLIWTLLKGMWRSAKQYNYMKSICAGFIAFLVNSIGWFPIHVTALICPIVFFVSVSELMRR